MSRICLPLMLIATLAVSVIASTSPSSADEPDERRVEMGSVDWKQDFESAKQIASQTSKPMFVLFQEIPGCQTCQTFGQRPLSHPLMVEAIEELFVPVLVYNNRKGKDAILLERFSEPSWNNPVVRYLDPAGKDLIERKDGVWTIAGTAKRMIAALESAGDKPPKYLSLLAAEKEAKTETATFAMHCYWEGEGLLGSIQGVHATRSAWRGGLEVVDVKYDPAVVNYAELVDSARTMECASRVFAHSNEQLAVAKKKVGKQAVLANDNQSTRDAKTSDQKYYLRQTPLIHLPLTEFQATKINAALKTKQPFESWLSGRQRDLLVGIVAAKKSNPAAFEGLAYPEQPAKLADYWKQVEIRLAELTESKKPELKK
jgi:hypothetical protein